jgi:hypothetical protein
MRVDHNPVCNLDYDINLINPVVSTHNIEQHLFQKHYIVHIYYHHQPQKTRFVRVGQVEAQKQQYPNEHIQNEPHSLKSLSDKVGVKTIGEYQEQEDNRDRQRRHWCELLKAAFKNYKP